MGVRARGLLSPPPSTTASAAAAAAARRLTCYALRLLHVAAHPAGALGDLRGNTMVGCLV